MTSPNDDDNTLFNLWSDRLSNTTKKVVSGYMMGLSAWRLFQNIQSKVVTHFEYTVTVPSTDELYFDLVSWLLDLIPRQKRRSLRIGSRHRRTNDWSVVDDGAPPAEGSLRVSFDGRKKQEVNIEGHKVSVVIISEGSSADEGRRPWSNDRMVFTARSVEGQEAVLAFLDGVIEKRNSSKLIPRLLMASKWGDWNTIDEVPLRSLDTVYLDGSLIQEICDDLQLFLDNEFSYHRLGIPWRRGYVFHGPPGTGKSSLAKALANHFKLDVFFLPLADIGQDANLLSLVSSVRAKGILLIEDVDILHAATERSDQGEGASMSALLNALDGITTPNGLITIMTTNNLDKLDPALLRAGRSDRLFEIGHLTDDQAAQIVGSMTGNYDPLPTVEGLGMAPADLIEVMKHHIVNPGEAWVAVSDEIEARSGVLTE